MDGSIQERLDSLRREITQIHRLNLAYLQTPRAHFTATNDHERRKQRLREIMAELESMTDWKKPLVFRPVAH
jgi:hypothetical protein